MIGNLKIFSYVIKTTDFEIAGSTLLIQGTAGISALPLHSSSNELFVLRNSSSVPSDCVPAASVSAVALDSVDNNSPVDMDSAVSRQEVSTSPRVVAIN